MSVTSHLSKEDCLALLKTFDGQPELKCFKIQPFCEELRGYLGEHFLLTLTTQEEKCLKNLTFFVKSLRGARMCQMYPDAKFFEKELFVYQFCEMVKRNVVGVSLDFMPQLRYHTNEEVIVLNNLAEDGYKDGQYFFDEAHMRRALETLAQFHSVTIAFEEAKSKELGRTYEVTETYGEFDDPIFHRNKESSNYKFMKSCQVGCLALIDEATNNKEEASRFKENLMKYFRKVYKLMNEKNNYRKVISHGDLWGNNTLFKYANNVPVHCKLVDFQLVRYVPPAFDVTNLIYFASERSVFRRNVHDYYQHYYDALKNEVSKFGLDLGELLSLKEFNETCKVYIAAAKLIWLGYKQTSYASKVSMGDIGLDFDLYKAVMLGDKRAWFVRVNYQHDSKYRNYLASILQDNKLMMMNEHICIEDCFKIVRNTIGMDEDFDLIDVKMTPLDERGGFLGEHYILVLTIKTKSIQEFNYFVKLAPFAESQKSFFEDTGADYKERRFYNKILPDFTKCGIKMISEIAPKCYLVDDGIIVLDNLQKMGYECKDKRKSMSLKSIKEGLNSIAKLHAAGIIYEEKHGNGLKLNEMYPEEFKESFYTTNKVSVELINAAKMGVSKHVELFSNYTSNITPEQLITLTRRVLDDYRNLVLPSSRFRNTICHGDLWANNIMFAKNAQPLIVDFQSYRYVPPAHDVMQNLYLATNREFRAKHMGEVLDYYYSLLRNILEKNGCNVNSIISREDFLESCEEQTLLAVSQSLSHKHNISLSKERMHELFSDPDYCHQALFVDRSHNIEHTCSIDPVYKTICEESIADLRELLENYVKIGKIKC